VLLKKVFVLSTGSLFNTIISSLFGIYVTRVLGPETKGVLTIALTSCDLIMMLFSFGIPYSTAYYIRSHPGSSSVVLRQTNWSMIICGVLSLCLIILGKDIFSSLFLGGWTVDGVMATLLILTVFMNSGNIIIGAALIAQGNSNGYVMSTNIGALANIACTIALFALLQHYKLHAVLLGNLAGILIATILMRRSFRLSFGTSIPTTNDLTLRKFYTYGIQAQSGALAALVFKRIDLYIISHFLNISAVGFYSVGLGLRDLAMTVSRALAGLAAGDMADPEKQKDGTAQGILKSGIILNIVMSLIAFLGAAVIFPYFIPLAYGESFSKSVTISIIIMVSMLPFSIAFLLGKAIQSKGKPLYLSIGNVIGAIICSIVVWQFTEHFGIVGAAVATIIDSTVLLVLGWILLNLSGDWKYVVNIRQK
jgi:O-antigen/teichoic acid export membrane protein